MLAKKCKNSIHTIFSTTNRAKIEFSKKKKEKQVALAEKED